MMAKVSRTPIMVVEDDASLREALRDTLELAGYAVIDVPDGPSALDVLEQQRLALVATDVQMSPMDGHTLLREIKARFPYVPVLLMTAYGQIEKAVDAMRHGACNYLVKPFEPQKLLAEVARFMVTPESEDTGAVVAEDPRSRETLDLARRVAGSHATIFITGESGTGKEVIARYIHQHSPRADGPFVAINCAAIPENLMEATLFGHEKGAYTGASGTQPGKFEQAQNGTLLLDEVSEIPIALQAKLLRVLQEREVERVGGRKTIPLDVRVLATSNRDMLAEVRKGTFREDLYYRLNVFPLELPALRERIDDLIPLARHMLIRFAEITGRAGLTLSKAAEQRLTQHDWPGNIRELENVMQRAMILASGDVIEAEHLYLPQASVQPAKIAGGQDMKSLEKAHILETLEAVKGSRKRAAERLGISERTLRYKLQQYREEDGESSES